MNKHAKIIILKNEMYVQVNLLPKGDNIRNFMIVYLKKNKSNQLTSHDKTFLAHFLEAIF